MLGYGAQYCLLYVDPGSEPVRYLASLIKNGPILLLNITGQMRMGTFMAMSPRLQNIVWIGAMAQWCAALAIILAMLRTDRRAAFCSGWCSFVPDTCLLIRKPNERAAFFYWIGRHGSGGARHRGGSEWSALA